MVSTIWMPETVEEASFPLSRICTRVMFTRLRAMIRETMSCSRMAASPTMVISTL